MHPAVGLPTADKRFIFSWLVVFKLLKKIQNSKGNILNTPKYFCHFNKKICRLTPRGFCFQVNEVDDKKETYYWLRVREKSSRLLTLSSKLSVNLFWRKITKSCIEQFSIIDWLRHMIRLGYKTKLIMESLTFEWLRDWGLHTYGKFLLQHNFSLSEPQSTKFEGKSIRRKSLEQSFHFSIKLYFPSWYKRLKV